ncbi:MAG: glycosyltransferase family 4 protein [Omnitrophica bacterium]|nr:glycosyltransferase family 4 protein [Candidatus Omnitrophota bacterium]
MDKRKIIFLDHGQGAGGSATNLISLIKNLNKNKFEPSVVFSSRSMFSQRIIDLGVPVITLKGPAFMSISFEIGGKRICNPFAVIFNLMLILVKAAQLYIYLISTKALILQTNEMFEHIYGGLAAQFSKTFCVWHMQEIPSRGSLFGVGRIFLNIAAIILPKKIIVISKAVRSAFCRYIQRKTIIIYNGTALADFCDQEKFGLGKTNKKTHERKPKLAVVMVARLVPWKGHRVFLKAAKLIHDRFPYVKFFIAGDLDSVPKRYAVELQTLVRKLGIQDVISFTGHVENIEDVLQLADIVVHCPIRPEPFGLAIIEAMAFSKPVIASDIGATSEIIVNMKDGILVRPNDPVSLAEATMCLIVSEKKRADLGAAARKAVKQKFTLQRFSTELEELYSSLSNKR